VPFVVWLVVDYAALLVLETTLLLRGSRRGESAAA
jgi:hypothetical protein